MMRKNLQHIKLVQSPKSTAGYDEQNSKFLTTEGFALKSTYSEQDINDLEHLDYGAGFAPNLRGIQSTMYVQNLWKIQSTNNSSIHSVEDMKVWINEFSVDAIAVLRTTTDSILPVIAFYIVAAEELNLEVGELSGIIQNDSSKALTTPESYRNSLRIINDILEYTNTKIPRFNPISISGYSAKVAGTSVDKELAFPLIYGLELIQSGLKRGMKIDDVAPQLSFSFNVGMNHFFEIAKMRAARMLWAKLVKQFNPKDATSLELRIHSQTLNWNEKDSFDNVTRTCIEGSAAILGGTQSLQTIPSADGVDLPNELSIRIARNTQLFLQTETKITKTVDPWAGSFYVESLTNEIVQKTWQRIEEIENCGGMFKAISSGLFQADFYDEIIQPKNIDIQKSVQGNANRDIQKVKLSLEKLKKSAQSGEGNLLDLAIEAARNRATLNEISNALENINA